MRRRAQSAEAQGNIAAGGQKLLGNMPAEQGVLTEKAGFIGQIDVDGEEEKPVVS